MYDQNSDEYTNPGMDPGTEDTLIRPAIRRRTRVAVVALLIVSAMLFALMIVPFQRVKADEYKLTKDITIKISGPHNPAQAEKLAEIMKFLDENYYRELSNDELLDALGRGLLEAQDTTWTYYMSDQDYEQMKESMTGEYSGIGAGVSQEKGGGFKLLEPVEGGPAYEAGILHGDYIIKVDDTDAANFASATELATAVRGEPGTEVTIVVFRPSTSEELTFELTRRKIEAVNVRSELLEDKIAYIYMREFTANLPTQFAEHMKNMVDLGAEDFIFDLRHNPGGDAWALRQVLDMLLDEALICRVEGRSDGTKYVKKWVTQDGKIVTDDARFVILLSRDSASASELFSGSLRDNAGAVLVGETTFGKGSGTVSFPLQDGSAANITIFRYILPNGQAVEGEGIAPHFPVALSGEQMQTPISEIPHDEDAMLQTALELLHQDPEELAKQIEAGATEQTERTDEVDDVEETVVDEEAVESREAERSEGTEETSDSRDPVRTEPMKP